MGQVFFGMRPVLVGWALVILICFHEAAHAAPEATPSCPDVQGLEAKLRASLKPGRTEKVEVKACAGGHFPEPGWVVIAWVGSPAKSSRVRAIIGVRDSTILAQDVRELSRQERKDVKSGEVLVADLDGDGVDEFIEGWWYTHANLVHVVLRRVGTTLAPLSEIEARSWVRASNLCPTEIGVSPQLPDGSRRFVLFAEGRRWADCKPIHDEMALRNGALVRVAPYFDTVTTYFSMNASRWWFEPRRISREAMEVAARLAPNGDYANFHVAVGDFCDRSDPAFATCLQRPQVAGVNNRAVMEAEWRLADLRLLDVPVALKPLIPYFEERVGYLVFWNRAFQRFAFTRDSVTLRVGFRGSQPPTECLAIVDRIDAAGSWSAKYLLAQYKWANCMNKNAPTTRYPQAVWDAFFKANAIVSISGPSPW